MTFHMLTRFSFCLLILLSLATIQAANPNSDLKLQPNDWPWWRGPQWTGIAPADQAPPQKWDLETNVVWKTAVPGRGHGSPTIVGDQVFLASADEEAEIQYVLCYNRKTGEEEWRREIHRGGFTASGERQGNSKSTKASASVACDGERLFVTLFNSDAIHLTALTRTGEILWQKKVSDYVIHQGYGASPTIYGPLVIAVADNRGGGAIVGFNRETGERVWEHARPAEANYTSPIIVNVNNKDQLLFTGCNLITSLNPLTGEVIWEVEGSTVECVTSTVTNGEYILSSGGYPDQHTTVLKADGSGDIVWTNRTKSYVPSLVLKDNNLYAVTDNGIAICYDFLTGGVLWRNRLSGDFTSSPVLVDDVIYVTNESGETFIYEANPMEFKSLGENKLGDECFATPVITGSQIFTRVAFRTDEGRQEYLYCLGDK
ncbi:outer membrane biogenesis protein BamB [Polystyrenella longa]|uniref:Outer membrane biogenesis protein BamB n=2 Tax=Polystyrenella longa TaxID=2528007 RepID=A0A518CP35_9PLAN|nr:outer membrane biogenesis protein BamB [Polystyrenella longa]